MSELDNYSDAESVIEDTDQQHPSSSGGILATLRSVGSKVSNLLNLSSSQCDKSMDSNGNKSISGLRPGQQALRTKVLGQQPPPPQQQQYKVFKTKNDPSNESESNKNNIRSALKPTGIGRGMPVMTAAVNGPPTRFRTAGRAASDMPPGQAFPRPTATQSTPPRTVQLRPPALLLQPPRGPVLSSPEDSPIKCNVCHTPSGRSNHCTNCNRAQSGHIFNRPFSLNPNSNDIDCGMPSLKIENPEQDQRDSKRPRSSDSDVEEIVPPNLRKETPVETVKTIPETPPKDIQETSSSLKASMLYLGNIPCDFKDIKLENDCIHLMSISPKPLARFPNLKTLKFNIKVPFSEVESLFHYTERRSVPEKGHYMYLKPHQLSSNKIMETLHSTLVDDRWLFDPCNPHEGVKFIFLRCEIEFNINQLFNYLHKERKLLVNVNSSWNQQRYQQITTNAYQRSLIDSNISTPSKRGGRAQFRSNTTRNPVPSTSRSHRGFTFTDSPVKSDTPPRKTARMGSRPTKPTTVEIVELDDDDDEDDSLGSKKETSCVSRVEPIFEPDQMLFGFPPYDPAVQVQIYGRDLDCLAPQEYLNDNIIDFYLQYVMSTSVPAPIKEKTHIFTTFFFTKLTGGKRENISIKDKATVVYERVKKWLKRVDIFSKDYIVIPVNRSHHWFLVIVCNANNVQDIDGSAEIQALDDLPKAKRPCIIVMDSLGIVRTGGVNKLTNPIRYALEEEWKSKKKGNKKFDHTNIPDRNIKPPLQDNSYDCGLFLIKYVECFLKDPHKVLGAPRNQLGRDFLEVKDAKNLRRVIKDTIYELHKFNQEVVVQSISFKEEGGEEDDDSKEDKSKMVKLDPSKNKSSSKPGPASAKNQRRTSGGNKSSASDSEMEVIDEIKPPIQPKVESTVYLNDTATSQKDDSTLQLIDSSQEMRTSDVNDESLMTDDEDPIASPSSGMKRRSSSVVSIQDLKDDAAEGMEVTVNEATTSCNKDENEDVSNKNGVIDISTEDEADLPKKADGSVDQQIDELTALI